MSLFLCRGTWGVTKIERFPEVASAIQDEKRNGKIKRAPQTAFEYATPYCQNWASWEIFDPTWGNMRWWDEEVLAPLEFAAEQTTEGLGGLQKLLTTVNSIHPYFLTLLFFFQFHSPPNKGWLLLCSHSSLYSSLQMVC